MVAGLKRVSVLFLILLVCIAAGFALMVLVYCLPAETIIASVKDSAEIFEIEGSYPELIYYRSFSGLDNYTDALMLSEAAFDSDESAVVKAMLNTHYGVKKLDPAESIVKIYGEGKSTDNLSVHYGRYWHGYLIFLKPLLSVFSYGTIRELMVATQVLMVGGVVILMCLRGKPVCALAAVMTYVFLFPPALGLSLQYNTMFMLTFLQLLVISACDRPFADRRKWPYWFMVVGCMTSYFDFLTYPLVSFGVPMLLLLELYPEKPATNFVDTVKSGLSWLVGYACMWGSKAIIATAITGQDIVSDTLKNAQARTIADSGLGLGVQAVINNIKINPLMLALTALLVILALALAIIKKNRIRAGEILIYCAFMAAPLAWYIVASNHSYIHSFFTYRTLAISVFGAVLLCGRLAGLDKNKVVAEHG